MLCARLPENIGGNVDQKRVEVDSTPYANNAVNRSARAMAALMRSARTW
jgi:hypothetical protein